MNVNYELQVMRVFYLARSEDIHGLRLYQISKLAGISKSELQRILPRLIKRGWLRRHEEWSITGIIPNDISDYSKKKSYDDLKNDLDIKELPYDKKRFLLNSIMSRRLPRKYVFYSLLSFPFLSGKNSNNVPNGSKRFWKRIANEVMNYEKDIKRKPNVAEVQEKKMKILQVVGKKYRLQDPDTKEVIEVDESEIIRVPNKKSSIASKILS